MSINKKLADIAMTSAEGYKLTKGEKCEVKPSTLIQLYVSNVTTYQGIEGVRINRAPRPVKIYKADSSVKKMFVMSNLINEECHAFDNLIIFN